MPRFKAHGVPGTISQRYSAVLAALLGLGFFPGCGPSDAPASAEPPKSDPSKGAWRHQAGASEYWAQAIRAYPNGIPAGAWATAHRELEPLRPATGVAAQLKSPSARGANSPSRDAADPVGVHGLSWTPMGPAPLTGGQSWPNSGKSNASGRASVVAVNSAAPSNGEYWLGSANGGVWHRAAGESKWEALTDYASSLAVGAIAVDKCSAAGTCTAIYVGTGENAFRRDTYYGNGVLFLHPVSTPHAQLTGDAAVQMVLEEHFGEPGPESMFRSGSVQNLLVDPQSPESSRTLYLTVSKGMTTNATDSSVLTPPPASGFGVFRLDLATSGPTWIKKTPTASQVPAGAGAVDLEMDPVNTQTLYVAFEGNGIWKSTDRGETWTNFNAGIPASLVSGPLGSPRPEIALIRPQGAAGPTLYAILGIKSALEHTDAGLESCLHPFDPKIPFGGCVPSLFKIVDTGAAPQWQEIAVQRAPGKSGPCGEESGDDYSQPLFQYGPYTHALALVPGTNPQELLFGGINLWRSVDDGKTWSAATIDNDAVHPDFHQLLIPNPADPNFVLATNDGGLYSSHNRGGPNCSGGTQRGWKSENDFLGITGFQSIAASPLPGSLSVIGGTQDNGTNIYSGIQTWTHESDGDSAFALFDLDQLQGGVHFDVGNMGGEDHLLPRTVPGGEKLGAGKPIPESDDRAFYPPMIQRQGGTGAHPIFFGTNRVWQLDPAPERKNWTAISCAELGGRPATPPPLVENPTNVITALAAAPSPSTRIYAGFYDGQIWTATNPDASSCPSGTAGWTRIDDNKGLPKRVVTSLATDPDDDQTLYVTFSGFGADHVFVSSNNLGNFNSISTGLSPNDPVNAIAVEKGPPKMLWIGTDHGVFRSRADLAGGWTQDYLDILVDCPGGICAAQRTQLPNVPVYALALDEPNHRLYAGTHGRGGWVLAPSPIVATFEGWVDGTIWDIPTYGSGFKPNQTNCSVSVLLADGTPCATDTKDAMGGVIGTNFQGELSTSLGSQYNGKPVVWACRQSGCVGGKGIKECQADKNNPISRVHVECPGIDGNLAKVDGPIGDCPASISPPSSGLRLNTDPGAQPLAFASSGAQLSFQVHAVLQVGQGGSDDLCAADVPFSPGEEDGEILTRAADAINASPSCIQAGVKGVFVDEGKEHSGEDSAGGARLSLSAPTVAGTQLVTSIMTTPGVPSEVCFAFDNIGNVATHALLISQLKFSTLPTGAKGGSVELIERSMLGDCSVSVPTSAGQTSATIANALNSALATSSADCPALQNPQDATVDGDSLIFISAQQVVVCIHDDGLGFSFRPKEVDIVNACAAGVDTTPPVFTSVPPAVTITQCTSPSIGQATATDACGVTVTNDAPPSFHVGTTVVTWTAVDPAGNRTTATQTVKVGLGDDPSCCPVGSHVIVGTARSDVLIGTSGKDCILGLDGADFIDGRGGDDVISGGAGCDFILGGLGNDTIFGGGGADIIDGNSGDDFIDGGGGFDVCAGGVGTDAIANCKWPLHCTASCCRTHTCSL